MVTKLLRVYLIIKKNYKFIYKKLIFFKKLLTKFVFDISAKNYKAIIIKTNH